MTVRKSLIETHDTLILSLHADEIGDGFYLPRRPTGQVTLIAWGEGSVIEHHRTFFDVEAPAMILFPAGDIQLEARSDTFLVYCLYDKGAGPLQDVRAFVNRP